MAKTGEQLVARPDRTDAEISSLVEKNMALAHHFVHKWQHLDPQEALSVAMDGLLRAAQSWDPSRGIPFGSYASLWIKWRGLHHRKKSLCNKRGNGAAVMVSLDATLMEGGTTTWGDLLVDEAVARPDDDRLAEEQIGTLLAGLKPKEREVMEKRYGLNNYTAQTLDEVGASMGLTRERVRQIQKFATAKLAARVNKTPPPRAESKSKNKRRKT